MSSIQIARSAAEKLVETHGISAPPVDIEFIARTLGIEVVLDDLGNDVSGLLVSRGRTACIAVRKTDAPVRRRFTIAHEVGHFVLGHSLQQKALVHADQQHQVIYRSQSASEGLDPREVQANQFAASILMPAKLLREAAARLGAPLRDTDVSTLAREFKVSEVAMTIRLTTIGLL